jgi:chorismate synthase
MSSQFGQIFQISTFGESHGTGLGVIIDGMPAGIDLSIESIQKDLDKRRPGTSKWVSQRNETDQIQILSGVADGKTLGSPIALVVINQDARSKDYSKIAHLFRPGHADYTYFKKYGLKLQPGGGRSSGRETLARVAAGAVAKALLESLKIDIQAYTISIGDICAEFIDPDFAQTHPLRCADPNMADEMLALVDHMRSEGNSIGGIIQVVAHNVPSGLGEPVFHKLDAMLAMGLISIGAVKGIAFGAGFNAARMKGSEHNDPITPQGFNSNNAGGILGGISNGDDIVMQLAIKPTPSISISQATIDNDGNPEMISIKGRHDPCICSRICPVAEAMTAIVLADAFLLNQRQVYGVKS